MSQEAATGQLAGAVAHLSGLLLSQESVDTVVGLVTRLVTVTLPGTTGAGVTLVDERGRRTTAATDALVGQADALQYDLDEGPCLSAWRDRRVVRIDDVVRDGRWSAWAEAVAPLGVRSVLSAPLVAGADSIGAIKAYSGAVGAYDDHDEDVLRLFAQQAAVVLSNVATHDTARGVSAQLTGALRTRDVIGQAKGVLMARGAADEEAAFSMLVSASQRSQRKLHEVARQLVVSATARR